MGAHRVCVVVRVKREMKARVAYDRVSRMTEKVMCQYFNSSGIRSGLMTCWAFASVVLDIFGFS